MHKVVRLQARGKAMKLADIPLARMSDPFPTVSMRTKPQ